MVEQSKLDVSKWQAARRQFLYDPALWFFYRMIEVAFLDASTGNPMIGPLRPGEARPIYATDESLLARDWIARSQSAPARAPHEFVSFPECCEMLGLDAERERMALLETIDKAVETDNDEAWARLDELSAREPVDDVEPLFDAPRVVPALDQLALF
jgi:hypothetical protein